MPKQYNTPKRTFVVKTRMTEEEHEDFIKTLNACGMSQAEFLRQAITGTPIRPIIQVSQVNDELLSSLSKLNAEYGRIGNNLNQIARHLNEYRSPYPSMERELTMAAADLAQLKFEILQKVGEAIGNIQAYQL